MDGLYVFADLVRLLAQNVTKSFTKKYTPLEHPRILQYLKTTTKRQVIMPTFTNSLPKGKGQVKRQKVQDTKQRSWTYLQEPATSLTSPGPYQPAKDKGKDKGKSKGKGKGKGKSKGKGKGKAIKEKDHLRGKEKHRPKVMPHLLVSSHFHQRQENLIMDI
jgi:hypothetical protein